LLFWIKKRPLAHGGLFKGGFYEKFTTIISLSSQGFLILIFAVMFYEAPVRAER